MIKSVSFVVEFINVDTDDSTIIVRLMDGRPVLLTSSFPSLGEGLHNLLREAAREGREHAK